MEYLAQKHIYHGDLAARNVLLTESLVAKISDFGLARRFYEDISMPQPILKETDAEFKVPLILPMKWLPLEVLQHHKITPEKSDVWSFGVLTWEIFQLGADPYRKGNFAHNRISPKFCCNINQGRKPPCSTVYFPIFMHRYYDGAISF